MTNFVLLIIFIFIGHTAALADHSAKTKASDDQVTITVKKEISTYSNSPSGSWDVSIAWVEIDTIIDYTEALRGIIKYTPAKTSPACENISFIQTAKVVTNENSDYEWPLGEAPRNTIKTKEGFGIKPNYYIDHMAVNCEQEDGKCSPYFRDYWPNEEDGSKDGKNNGEQSPAVLVDYPFGWDFIKSIELEACAVCRESSKVLSCFQWGGIWDIVGEPEFIINGSTDKPTGTWIKALENFNMYYGK
jgi:hypothetical protein